MDWLLVRSRRPSEFLCIARTISQLIIQRTLLLLLKAICRFSSPWRFFFPWELQSWTRAPQTMQILVMNGSQLLIKSCNCSSPWCWCIALFSALCSAPLPLICLHAKQPDKSRHTPLPHPWWPQHPFPRCSYKPSKEPPHRQLIENILFMTPSKDELSLRILLDIYLLFSSKIHVSLLLKIEFRVQGVNFIPLLLIYLFLAIKVFLISL